MEDQPSDKNKYAPAGLNTGPARPADGASDTESQESQATCAYWAVCQNIEGICGCDYWSRWAV